MTFRRFLVLTGTLAGVLAVALYMSASYASSAPSASSASSASAATGDLLKTVHIPAAAQCSSGLGTSVTIVPGSMINMTQPILLVTSCFQLPQGDKLYFLDPATDPATLVKTITTTGVPPEGWGSLSLRGDKGDLIGCGNDPGGTHTIKAIDISPFNATPDGTSTTLFDAASGFDICDGVTWDTADNTIFQSPDVSRTIYHFSATGGALGTIPSPGDCPNSGLAVGGASLFAACNGHLKIYQLNKSTGAVFTSFGYTGSRTEDLECDPASFAPKDAMWSKDAFDNEVFAFEIPSGTCGFAGGPPVVPAACPDGSTTDSDGDALLNCWETNGIDFNGDGTVDLKLYDVNKDGTIQAGEKADPNHKDIYLEADWMAQHQPNATAVNNVIASFANAPVGNPDGTTGVRLHIQSDEQAVAHNDNLAFEPCTGPAMGGTPDFDTVKNAMFGTAAERAAGVNVTNAKRFAFHYVLFVHNLLGLGGTSGCAELPGNDFVVSLGSWTSVGGHPVGTTDQQGGTLMHEFGHNLNLRHGGSENTNCKPNYLSVMSYTRQIDNVYVNGRPLDYSRSALPTLNEASLSEPAGIGGSAGDRTAFGPPPTQNNVNASGAIDWNVDGDSVDMGVNRNINNLGNGCGGSGTVLPGYNDWANLKYDFRSTTDFADGVHLSTLSADESDRQNPADPGPDTDGDGVPNIRDNCPFAPNPDQADSNQNGIGDACEFAAPASLDHFRCYDVKGNDQTKIAVTLEDQFGKRSAVVKKPIGLCAPASKNGSPVSQPQAHLKCYDLEKEDPKKVNRDVEVTNQFGKEKLKVDKVESLCTPASKSLTGTPGPPPQNLDHFECYKVKGGRDVKQSVMVQDQFGTETVKVKGAKLLCNPVSKNGGSILNRQAHLVCYDIDGKAADVDVNVNDQFGLERLRVKKPKTLCVPSEKREL
jgi:hypothetical protein